MNTTDGPSDDDVQNSDNDIDDDEKKPAAIKSSAFDSSCVATTSSGRDATTSAIEKATATKKKDVRKISGCRIKKEKKEEEEDPQKDNNDVPNHQKDNRRSPNRYDERWMGMFQKLVEYKKQYKNTMVPFRYKYGPNLGIWVTTQRRYYKKGDLHPNQADLLKSIGFEWDGLKCKAVSNQMIWMDMFQKVVDKKQHKNTLVPQPNEEDPKLGQWVNMQRHKYKNKKLLPQRIYILKSIGFDLECAKAATYH